MSNVYPFEPNPSYAASIWDAADANPDQAARALQLAQVSGAPPELVAQDVEGHERELKADMGSEIARRNRAIRDYILANPLGASVSNDDWGALDKATRSAAKVGEKGFWDNTLDAAGGMLGGIVASPVEKADEIAENARKFMVEQGVPADEAERRADVLHGKAIRGDIVQKLLMISPFIGGLKTMLLGAAGVGGMSALTGAQRTYITQPLEKEHPGLQDFIESVETAVGLGLWGLHLHRATTHLREGKVPPPGLSPESDEVHAADAKDYAEKVAKAVKDAAATATAERSTPLMTAALQHAVGDGDIGIAADAIRELYGEKEPAADDGLLGWIPNLADRLRVAEESGGDVTVPVADYIAQMAKTPDVGRALLDHVRRSPDAVTVAEAKELPKAEAKPEEEVEPAKPPDLVGEAVAAVRKAAAIDKPAVAKAVAEGAAGREELVSEPYPGLTKLQTAFWKQRLAEDREAAAGRASRSAQRKLSPEWTAKRKAIREAVAEEVAGNPIVKLDHMLQAGRKFNETTLTAEEKAKLPPKAYGPKGDLDIDDVENVLGVDGRRALDGIAQLAKAREAAGGKPEAFWPNRIKAMAEQRLEAEHGRLGDSVIAAATKQVLSDTALDILDAQSREYVEAGEKSPLSAPEYRDRLRVEYGSRPMHEVSVAAHIREAGRAGRDAAMAAEKGQRGKALQHLIRQYNAMYFARLAQELEARGPSFKRLVKGFSERTRDTVDQEYTNWARELLDRAGIDVIENRADHAELMSKNENTTLDAFVRAQREQYMHELEVAPAMQGADFNLRVRGQGARELLVDDFKDLHDSLKSLNHVGRMVKAAEEASDKAKFTSRRAELIDSLDQHKRIAYDPETGERVERFHGIRQLLRWTKASTLGMETVLDSEDRYDPNGPWNKYVYRPMIEGSYREAELERKTGERLGKIKYAGNLKERINDNPLLLPDHTGSATISRKGFLAALVNMGNESNFRKLATGYFEPSDAARADRLLYRKELTDYMGDIRDWVDKNATKADYDYVQAIWDVYEELHQLSGEMYEKLSGVAPESLVIKPLATPFGEYRGGYYPLIRHPGAESVKLEARFLEGQGYIRAPTANGYTKERTGATYPLALNLDKLPTTMRQIIHDIALRPAAQEVARLVYDDKLNHALRTRIGDEYAAMFQPWLKDIVNAYSDANGKLAAGLENFAKVARRNAIVTLIAFRQSTVMKHAPTAALSSMAEVGPGEFLAEVQSMFANPEYGRRAILFALEKSKELPSRGPWAETLSRGQRVLEGKMGSMESWQDSMAEIGLTPVAWSDMASSIPTWNVKFRQEMQAHGNEADAVYAADKAVRRAHGSLAAPARSAALRARGVWPFLTSFMTFMNDLFNRQVETLWRAGDAVGLVRSRQYGAAMREARNVFGRTMAYVVGPAIIEHMVSPPPHSDDDPLWKHGLKAVAHTSTAGIPLVRDVVGAAIGSEDPKSGLISTMFKSVTDVVKDAEKDELNPQTVIRHGFMLAGMLTGMTPIAIGDALSFGVGAATDDEDPEGPWGWLVGTRYGTLKGHSKTWEDWRDTLLEGGR